MNQLTVPATFVTVMMLVLNAEGQLQFQTPNGLPAGYPNLITNPYQFVNPGQANPGVSSPQVVPGSQTSFLPGASFPGYQYPGYPSQLLPQSGIGGTNLGAGYLQYPYYYYPQNYPYYNYLYPFGQTFQGRSETDDTPPPVRK